MDKEVHTLNDSPDRIVNLNLEYIGQLHALQAWYRCVRLSRIPSGSTYEHLRIITQAASELLTVSINERSARLQEYLEQRHLSLPLSPPTIPPCPISVAPSIPYVDHTAWISGLSDVDVQRGITWLGLIVDSIRTMESRLQHGCRCMKDKTE